PSFGAAPKLATEARLPHPSHAKRKHRSLHEGSDASSGREASPKAASKTWKAVQSGREALATRPVSGRDDASSSAAPPWSPHWSPQTARPSCEAHPGRRREGAEGSGQPRLERTVLTKAQEG